MKKKILAITLCIAMLAIAVVGGTLAYFTDTDYNQNVMVTGQVNIDQIEQQRNENGEFEEFEDNKQMFPVTHDLTEYDENGLFADPNAVDKFVSVKNTGKSNAFIRTIFAYEMGEGKQDIVGTHVHYLYTNNNGSKLSFGDLMAENGGEYVTVNVGGTDYIVGVYYYNGNSVVEDGTEKFSALAPEEVSLNSLKQVWLLSSVDNTFYDMVDGKYDILVMSQAVQTEGFVDAKTALDTAFGPVTDENVAKWFANSNYTNSHDQSADPAA